MVDTLVISELLHMLGTLNKLEDTESLLDTVCREFERIPGVEKAFYSTELLSDHANGVYCFKLHKGQQRAASLCVTVSNAVKFDPYHIYIQKCIPIIDAILEERRQAEIIEHLQQELRHIGGIAHDFNNSLGGIMGGVQLLQKRIVSDEISKKYLSLIFESAKHAAEITTALLTMTRKK